jgi:hypothetical protein
MASGAAAERAFAIRSPDVFVTYFREPSRYGEEALDEAREWIRGYVQPAHPIVPTCQWRETARNSARTPPSFDR